MGAYLSEPVTEKETVTDANSKLSYAASSMQGWRASMEDAHRAMKELPDNKEVAFFGVFDGHGGAEVAQFCQEHLHRVFQESESFARQDYSEALREAFLKMDRDMQSDQGKKDLAKYSNSHSTGQEVTAQLKQVLQQQTKDRMEGLADEGEEPETQAGTTSVVGVVTGNRLLCANAGDSRMVLSRKGKAVDMSQDHKPVNDNERRRIQNAGGFVQDGRVNGSLALSRAIGDVEFKQAKTLDPKHQIITADPEICEMQLEQGDEFFIIACDGIWDVFSSQSAVDFVRYRLRVGKNPKAITEELCDACLAENTAGTGIGCDNMTVILVVLKFLLPRDSGFSNY